MLFKCQVRHIDPVSTYKPARFPIFFSSDRDLRTPALADQHLRCVCKVFRVCHNKHLIEPSIAHAILLLCGARRKTSLLAGWYKNPRWLRLSQLVYLSRPISGPRPYFAAKRIFALDSSLCYFMSIYYIFRFNTIISQVILHSRKFSFKTVSSFQEKQIFFCVQIVD